MQQPGDFSSWQQCRAVTPAPPSARRHTTSQIFSDLLKHFLDHTIYSPYTTTLLGLTYSRVELAVRVYLEVNVNRG